MAICRYSIEIKALFEFIKIKITTANNTCNSAFLLSPTLNSLILSRPDFTV